MNEKRKHERVDSIYLLNYVHLGENEKKLMQGMGRTMNVSETGIMLETHVPFSQDDDMDVVVGLKDDMVTIRGKVIFSRTIEKGKHQAGIQFVSIDEVSLATLRRYIEAFNKLSSAT